MARKQLDQKSFIFILLILAVAVVAYFLIWSQAKEPIGSEKSPSLGQLAKPKIESSAITDYDSELNLDLNYFDTDYSDLNKLENDPNLNNIESDLKSLSF